MGPEFWPDLPGKVQDVVTLGGTHAGSAYFDLKCSLSPCSPALWQMRQASAFTAAYAARPLPAGQAYTSVASQFDEFVFPQPAASTLPGARNFLVQDICPGRPLDHLLMTARRGEGVEPADRRRRRRTCRATPPLTLVRQTG